MDKITKKDIARVRKSLEKAYKDYEKSLKTQDEELINRTFKHITFLEATLRVYQKQI